MNLKIYKFGGLALATRKQMNLVLEILNKDKNIKKLCIVSAMGRSGFPYSTDTLSLLGNEMISLKEKDRLLASGEIISSLTFCAFLKEQKINAIALSYLENGILANEEYGNGKVISYDVSAIKEAFKIYDVVIVPGFIARTEKQEVITLGRGNSDLSALIYGKAFDQDVYLYKDVKGVYPFLQTPLKRIKPYQHLSYKELEILLLSGASVISKDALDFAKKEGIVMHIQSFESDEKGTTIDNKEENIPLVLGFFNKDKGFIIASLYPKFVQEDLKSLFYETHTLLKNEEINENQYYFTLATSQLLLIKRRIIARYFKDFIKE